MTMRRAASGAMLCFALVLGACGGGSGRGGTDIAVSGVGPTNPVQSGDTAVFAMTVANIGDHDASGVQLVDLVGNQLALTSITCTATGGAVCPDPTGASMTVATMPAGSSLVFQVSARVTAAATGTLSNTLSATFSDDSDRGNNAATASGTAFTPNSNLVVTGTGPAETVAAGSATVFKMTVANAGPDAASAVHIVNEPGNNLTFTGGTCSASGGAVCPAAVGPVMDVATMPPGGALSFDINVVVAANLPSGVVSVITDTLTATPANDADRSNNAAVAQGTAYAARAGVAVSGIGPASVVPAGSAATFTMTVTNGGPDAATDMQLLDSVSGNLTLTGGSCTASGGATCPEPVSLLMNVPLLPAGGALTFNFGAVVAVGTNGVISNTLTATPTNDPDRGDNTAVATGTAAAYNLSVSATAPGGPIPGGSSAVFTMVVSNSGPAEATAVAISDVVGDNLTLTGVSCAAGGGAVCPAALGAAMVAPSIPAGGALTFNVQATVTAGTSTPVANAMSATGAGDSRPGDNTASASVGTVSADLGVSQTGAATVGAGGSTTFTAVVANPGPGTATNITVTETLSAGYAASVRCTASASATCPAVLGAVIAVPSLAAGRSLTFSYDVPVGPTQRGDIVNTVQIAGTGDPDTGNNAASVTTVAVDPRNGTYAAYAANGHEYQFTADFDAGQYTMAGNGATVQRSFTASPNGDFTVTPTSRFRLATDLVVGGHDFGAGVLPYVAARQFGTSVSQLGSAYNLASRVVPTNGAAPTTAASTARVSGNVLQVCRESPPLQTQSCGASALASYTLSASGDVYTAVDLAGVTAPIVFRLARVGASTIILGAAPAADGSPQLLVGLPDASGLAGGALYGASSTGDWVSITLTGSSYAVTGVIGGPDSTPLARSPSGPFSLLAGARLSDNQTIFVMQASPLAVVLGAPGGASGLLQLALP